MALKFYLRDATTSVGGTLPSAILGGTPVVTAAGAATNRAMTTTPGTSQASGQTTTDGTANSQLHVFRRWISPPLAAQTIAVQTIALHIGTAEANAASNFIPTFYLSVWRPGTGAVISSGVLSDVSAIVGTEPGTTQTATTISGSSARAVTTQQGDVLVLEMWRGSVAPGATTARTNTVYYDGTTEDSTTSNAAYIGFTNDVALYFAPQSVGAVGGIATAQAMGTAGKVNLIQPVSAVGKILSGEAFGANVYRSLVMATPGLVGYWRFGEANGAASGVDELGVNGGTYVGGKVNVAAGAIGDGNSAAGPVAANCFFNVGATTGALLAITDVVSVEAWVNRNGYGAGGWGCVVARGSGGYAFRIDQSSGATSGQIQFIKDRQAVLLTTSVGVPITGWHHVLCTKNGPAVKVYIDGVDVTTAVTNATLVQSGQLLFFGSDNNANFGGTDPYSGYTDDLAIYNAVVSPTDAAAHAAAGPVTGQPRVSQAQPVAAVGAISTGYASGTSVVARGATPISAVGAVASAGALGLPVVTGGWRAMLFTPAPGSGGDSADVEIRRQVASAGEALFSLRVGAGTHIQPADDQAFYLRLDAGTGSPNYMYLSRIFMSFPTNLLPAGAVVRAVRLHLAPVAGQSNLGAGFGYNAYSGAFATPAVPVVGDFLNYGTTAFASDVTFANFMAGLGDLVFNASGVAAVSTSGPSTFALRSTFDAGSAVPTWSLAATASMQFGSGDYATPGPIRPVLMVSYDMPIAAQSVAAVGAVASAQVVGSAVVARGGRTLTAVGGVGTAYVSGTAAVTRGVRPVTAVGAIGSLTALGLPVLSRGGRSVTAVGGVSTAVTLGLATVVRGGRTVSSVGGVASVVAFGQPLVVRAGDLSRFVSAVGAVPSASAFGVLRILPGSWLVFLTTISSSAMVGSSLVSVSPVSVSMVGGCASLVSFGIPVVSGVGLPIYGVSLDASGAVGAGRLSLTLGGQALEVRDYEGVGSIATPSKVTEIRVGQYPPYGYTVQASVGVWTPVPGRGYLLFVFCEGYFGGAVGVSNVQGNGLTWVSNGWWAAGARSLEAWRCVAPPGAFTDAMTINLSAFAQDVQWLLVELQGADTSGVNGASLLVAAATDPASSAGQAIDYNRVLARSSDFLMTYDRSGSAIAPNYPLPATTEVPSSWSRTRAVWAPPGDDYVGATSAAPAVAGNLNLRYGVEVSVGGSASPIWLSGVRVATGLAFGQGSVLPPSQRLGGGILEIPVDSLAIIGPNGYVSAATLAGTGLNASLAVGTGGVVQPGKRMTFVPRVPVSGSLWVPPGGSHLVLGATALGFASLQTNYILSRSRHGFVTARTQFAVALRAKRAIADVVVLPVTVASVVVAPVTTGSVVVLPYIVASVTVVRNEDELMTERDEFDIGDVARVTATVTSLGVLKDPAAVSFQYRTPDGLLTSTNAIRTGAGVYYGDIPCQQPGRHWWRISGSADASFGEEGAIRVRRSAVLDT